jgi:hypothetical protein
MLSQLFGGIKTANKSKGTKIIKNRPHKIILYFNSIDEKKIENLNKLSLIYFLNTR